MTTRLDLTDHHLLRRSADGDRAAFSAFVERHQDATYRFLRSLGATEADAEDLLQESFLATWRNADSFRGSGSARSWLFAVARNALHRSHRTRVGEPSTMEPLEALGERAGWGSDDQDAAVRALERRDCLDQAFARISRTEREILILRDVEGLTGRETADLLGLGLAAVKSRLHRARLGLLAALRELEDCGDG